MQPFERIQDRAIGRWRNILPELGIAARFLTNKHGPCPMCAGVDRYRFDDKGGTGSYICSRCGAGDGVGLVMRARGVTFVQAAQMIEAVLPSSAIVIPKASRSFDPARLAMGIWHQARPLDGEDPASRYLASRGLRFGSYPSMLRFAERATYVHDDRSKTFHPALVARFVSPDAETSTVHLTYLDDAGNKAVVPTVRKIAPGKIPDGGAVRLAASADTMGIAEGIETALSAAALFEVPVWAALSCGAMIKWQPPKTARSILIFGDTDASFAGQSKAYGLANRLQGQGYNVEVRLPDDIGDWNDVMQSTTASEFLKETA